METWGVESRNWILRGPPDFLRGNVLLAQGIGGWGQSREGLGTFSVRLGIVSSGPHQRAGSLLDSRPASWWVSIFMLKGAGRGSSSCPVYPRGSFSASPCRFSLPSLPHASFSPCWYLLQRMGLGKVLAALFLSFPPPPLVHPT